MRGRGHLCMVTAGNDHARLVDGGNDHAQVVRGRRQRGGLARVAGVPPRRRTEPDVGRAALARVLEAHTMEPGDLRDAVRYLLEEIAERAPGRSVEIRVPPYGAVQC